MGPDRDMCPFPCQAQLGQVSPLLPLTPPYKRRGKRAAPDLHSRTEAGLNCIAPRVTFQLTRRPGSLIQRLVMIFSILLLLTCFGLG